MVVMKREFQTSAAHLVKAFSGLKGEIHVHLEAGELAPWAMEIIRPLVHRVVCSHPQSNAWIAKDADKCDEISLPYLTDESHIPEWLLKQEQTGQQKGLTVS